MFLSRLYMKILVLIMSVDFDNQDTSMESSFCETSDYSNETHKISLIQNLTTPCDNFSNVSLEGSKITKFSFNFEDGNMVVEIIFGFLAFFALLSWKSRSKKGKSFLENIIVDFVNY